MAAALSRLVQLCHWESLGLPLWRALTRERIRASHESTAADDNESFSFSFLLFSASENPPTWQRRRTREQQNLAKCSRGRSVGPGVLQKKTEERAYGDFAIFGRVKVPLV